MNALRQMVFRDGKLCLTNPALKNAQQQLEQAIAALAAAMDAIIKDRDAKKQVCGVFLLINLTRRTKSIIMHAQAS